MATQRGRGRSFHEEFENGNSEDLQFITPQYDANLASQAIEHMKLTLEDDDSAYPTRADNDDDDDEEEEDEERFSRGRSRSRSLHALDENPSGVIPIDPNSIAQAESLHCKAADKVERSGPLPLREVETLKKVSSMCIY